MKNRVRTQIKYIYRISGFFPSFLSMESFASLVEKIAATMTILIMFQAGGKECGKGRSLYPNFPETPAYFFIYLTG